MVFSLISSRNVKEAVKADGMGNGTVMRQIDQWAVLSSLLGSYAIWLHFMQVELTHEYTYFRFDGSWL